MTKKDKLYKLKIVLRDEETLVLSNASYQKLKNYIGMLKQSRGEDRMICFPDGGVMLASDIKYWLYNEQPIQAPDPPLSIHEKPLANFVVGFVCGGLIIHSAIRLISRLLEI